MAAIIFAHPKSPVMFDPPPPDPREQPVAPAESVVRAKIAHNFERVQAGYLPDVEVESPTAAQLEVLDAQEAIERLAGSLGSYKRLLTLVRNIAYVHGEVL